VNPPDNLQISFDGGSGSDSAALAPAVYARLPQREMEFLNALREAPPLGSLTVAEERERMRRGQTARFQDYPVEVIEFASAACPVYVIRPREACDELPITFFLHGGGWVLGGLETHTQLLCQLALRSRRAIVFLDYPCAPETRFPDPVNICSEAIEDTFRAAAELGVSAYNFLLAGDSSGGNIALATALAREESGKVAPSGLVLLYPVTDYAMESASCVEFADDPNLSRRAMEWFWDHYLPEVSLRADALASPLRASVESFRHFPPTLIVTCEYDLLRDQGEALAAKLVEAGVEVTAVRWMGALHGFLVTEALLNAPSAQRCVDLVAQYCRRLDDTDKQPKGVS
jgi:acetyl esterase